MPPRVRCLVNPAAGRGGGARQVEPLRKLMASVEGDLVVTSDAADLTGWARRSARAGVERLLVTGGDGTLHHALQGLAGSETALGVLAAGTGNDLAGVLGLPSNVVAAARHCLEGEIRRIDLGRVSNSVLVGDDSRWFAGVAGVGFDSEVARFVNRGVRWLPDALVYPYGVVQTLRAFKAPILTLEHEGRTIERRIMLVAFANSPRFGGGMHIAPSADLTDGLLDVVVVREVPKRTLLTIFPKVYKGGHVGHPAVESFRAERVAVRLDREIPLYGDGEPMAPVGDEVLTIEVVPRALAVIV